MLSARKYKTQARLLDVALDMAVQRITDLDPDCAALGPGLLKVGLLSQALIVVNMPLLGDLNVNMPDTQKAASGAGGAG